MHLKAPVVNGTALVGGSIGEVMNIGSLVLGPVCWVCYRLYLMCSSDRCVKLAQLNNVTLRSELWCGQHLSLTNSFW